MNIMSSRVLLIELWKGEVEAIAAYEDAYRRTKNRLFLHIAKEERQHKAELERIMR